MTLSANQPRRGTPRAQSKNNKAGGGQKGYTGSNPLTARRGGTKDARSDAYPSTSSKNMTSRLRPAVTGQDERGYVRNEKAAGRTVHNTSAGRIRKIKG